MKPLLYRKIFLFTIASLCIFAKWGHHFVLETSLCPSSLSSVKKQFFYYKTYSLGPSLRCEKSLSPAKKEQEPSSVLMSTKKTVPRSTTFFHTSPLTPQETTHPPLESIISPVLFSLSSGTHTPSKENTYFAVPMNPSNHTEEDLWDLSLQNEEAPATDLAQKVHFFLQTLSTGKQIPYLDPFMIDAALSLDPELAQKALATISFYRTSVLKTGELVPISFTLAQRATIRNTINAYCHTASLFQISKTPFASSLTIASQTPKGNLATKEKGVISALTAHTTVMEESWSIEEPSLEEVRINPDESLLLQILSLLTLVTSSDISCYQELDIWVKSLLKLKDPRHLLAAIPVLRAQTLMRDSLFIGSLTTVWTEHFATYKTLIRFSEVKEDIQCEKEILTQLIPVLGKFNEAPTLEKLKEAITAQTLPLPLRIQALELYCTINKQEATSFIHLLFTQTQKAFAERKLHHTSQYYDEKAILLHIIKCIDKYKLPVPVHTKSIIVTMIQHNIIDNNPSAYLICAQALATINTAPLPPEDALLILSTPLQHKDTTKAIQVQALDLIPGLCQGNNVAIKKMIIALLTQCGQELSCYLPRSSASDPRTQIIRAIDYAFSVIDDTSSVFKEQAEESDLETVKNQLSLVIQHGIKALIALKDYEFLANLLFINPYLSDKTARSLGYYLLEKEWADEFVSFLRVKYFRPDTKSISFKKIAEWLFTTNTSLKDPRKESATQTIMRTCA